MPALLPHALAARPEPGTLRALCLLAGGLVVGFALAPEPLGAGAEALRWISAGVAALPVGLALASFASAAVRAEMGRLVAVALVVLDIWAVGMAAWGGFAAPYALGLLAFLAVTGAAAGAAASRRLPLALGLALPVALAAAAAFALAPDLDEAALEPRLLTGLLALEALALFLGGARHVRTRRRLLALAAHYRDVFEGSGDGLALLHPESLHVLDANPAYLALSGHALRDLRSKALPELLALPAAEVHAAAERARAAGHAALPQVQHRRSGALPLTLDLELRRARAGTVLLLGARDVTERQRRQAELEAAQERAAEMLRLKATFLNNMSHELRTPLVSVVGFAEILADLLEEDLGEMAESLLRSARRLQETLDALLDLTQLESRDTNFELEAVDVAEIAREVAMLAWPAAEEKGLEMRVSAEDGALAYADRAALHRILLNLLSNAVKFTEEGALTVAVTTDSHRVLVHVRDTGPGIAPELRPHLFEPFRQGSAGLGREHEGAGLGLTITKHLVDLLGGRIMLESAPEQGSTFSVAFPRAATTGDGAAEADGWEEPVMAARPRVLLADDNDDARRLMERTLAHAYDVASAGTAEAAFERARRAWFDAVVVDADLGGSAGGLELLRRLRTLSAYAFVPVVALATAAPDRERLLEAGFDACLLRPFTPRDLLWALEQLRGAAVEG